MYLETVDDVAFSVSDVVVQGKPVSEVWCFPQHVVGSGSSVYVAGVPVDSQAVSSVNRLLLAGGVPRSVGGFVGGSEKPFFMSVLILVCVLLGYSAVLYLVTTYTGTLSVVAVFTGFALPLMVWFAWVLLWLFRGRARWFEFRCVPVESELLRAVRSVLFSLPVSSDAESLRVLSSRCVLSPERVPVSVVVESCRSLVPDFDNRLLAVMGDV